jgi:ABC-type antimicrobial peptide transport system permease subunit
MTAAREREFGVRMALGSRPRAIAGLVLRQGAGWVVAGVLLGASGIIVVARLLRELLFGVPLFDPLTIGTSVAVLLACAIVALLGPLYRAARVDAVVALRSE